MSRVAGTVLTAQALRGVGYGFAAVQLGAVLSDDGAGPREVGLVLSAIVAGNVAASLAIGRWADRVGRRRSYTVLHLALVGCALAIAVDAPLWVVAGLALTGALSTEVVESGPFTTLEQVMLASTGASLPQLTRGYGVYNAVATLAGAAGATVGALTTGRAWFLLLAAVGLAGLGLATRLPATVDLSADGGSGSEARPRRPVARRGAVARLAALFAVDSLAGGFVVQAYIAYWLGVRYHASTAVIGLVFAAIGVLQTLSFLAAPVLAGRIGLLPTMVFTHLPSNLLLAAVPFAPTFAVAVVLLLARACLSQMDVPTRQAYVMAMVAPAERAGAAALTNTARYVTRPAGPALAGLLQTIGLAVPFVVAGAAKSGYDLALWRTFRRVPLADPYTPTGGHP